MFARHGFTKGADIRIAQAYKQYFKRRLFVGDPRAPQNPKGLSKPHALAETRLSRRGT
jgi:hypothetical protein